MATMFVRCRVILDGGLPGDWSATASFDPDTLTVENDPNQDDPVRERVPTEAVVLFGTSGAYVNENATLSVGSDSDPSTIEKTMRIPASEAVPANDAQDWQFQDSDASFRPRATGTTALWGSVVLPPGVTITQVAARGYRNDTGDTCNVAFKRRNNDDSVSSLASVNHASTGWATTTAALSETVAADVNYYYVIDLSTPDAQTDVRFAWLEITYTMPSYDKSI